MTAKFAFIPDRREMAKSVMWELYRQSRESVLKYVCCKPHLGSRSISRVGCQTCGKTKRNTHKKEIKRNVFKFGVCESTYEFCEASRSEKKKKKKKKTKESHSGILSFNNNSQKTNKQTNRCFCDHVGEHFSKNESSVSLASPSSLKFLTHSFVPWSWDLSELWSHKYGKLKPTANWNYTSVFSTMRFYTQKIVNHFIGAKHKAKKTFFYIFYTL